MTTSLEDKFVSETQTQIQLKQDPKSNVQLRPTAVTVTFGQAAIRPSIAPPGPDSEPVSHGPSLGPSLAPPHAPRDASA